MILHEGALLGPYRILAPIGKGGMGEIYSAEDKRLGRQVAIKVLPQDLAADPQALTRFDREARALATLSHPNILTIFDIGKTEDIVYVVTELLQGETLRVRLSRTKFAPGEAMNIARDLALGLAAAHSKGVIHRDIKPENIFLTAGGLLKILDFGLARIPILPPDQSVSSAGTIGAQTSAGTVMGTLHYMSPEQLRGEMLDPQTDIFSFGCVIHEILGGKAPFARETAAETMAAILREEPIELKDLSASWKRFLKRCLDKNKERRFSSAQEMLDALSFIETKPRKNSRARGKIDSLAVLPFDNTTGDADMEYLTDGITEDIIQNLSQLPKLKVIARATVFHYKGQKDPQQVGRALNVGAVLSGRVTARGEILSIRAELIDVENGWQLWGESYQRKFSDILTLQSEIAREISEKLQFKITGKQKKLLAKRHTDNTEAYQEYLKGRFFWNKRTEHGFWKAIEHFQQAIEKDPLYALAYTGLSDAYALLGDFVMGESTSPPELFFRARAAVDWALQLDDQIAEAHTSLAHLKMHAFEWSEAEHDFRRALQLNPGYATAHHWYFFLLAILGRDDEALQETNLAQELDPLSLIIQTDIATIWYFRREYDRAEAQLKKALQMDPNFSSAYRFLSAIYEQRGQMEEAISYYEKTRLLSGKETETIAKHVQELRDAFRACGVEGYWKQRLQIAEDRSKGSYMSPYSIAQLHSMLGDRDRAFALLEEAYKHSSPSIIYLRIDPRFDSLHADARFPALLQKMGLPPPNTE